ncbi:MAG TPA: 2-C-methyl-D-erythritol 2,4-cyclodiphosphate synthase [Clostridia bacterium]|nr:2-C-methyl-D-erythritol 2,4-cyclodiphosphate synthase [Clostridia bacterium]
MKSAYPSKVLIPLCGRTLLDRVLEPFATSTLIWEILVVAPPHLLDLFEREARGSRFGFKVAAVIPGGDTRGQSVRNGLLALKSSPDVVVVHDGARPFVTTHLIDRVVRRAFEHGAAIAAVQAVDTVKLVKKSSCGAIGDSSIGDLATGDQGAREDELKVVEKTLDRTRIWLAQTPQAFRTEILYSAYRVKKGRPERTSSEEAPEEASDEAADEAPWLLAPDDASLVEALGMPVIIEIGDPMNLKITHPHDLETARFLSACHAEGLVRVGFGHDVHRLVEGRKLVLGGVEIPYHKGLLGHSDADVLCHAIADALLGAAGLGDIGLHFPDTDERYKGARSLDLLTHVASLLNDGGWQIVNVDSVVVAEEPRISPNVERMRLCLSNCLGVSVMDINIKATTKEGLGPVGKGECIEAFAIAGVKKTAVSVPFNAISE